MSESSAMFLPPTVTARISGFKRLPLQSGQVLMVMYFSILSLKYCEVDSR